MRFIKKTASIVSSLIIVLAIGGFVFVRNFDLNKYKPQIQAMVEQQIGRQLVMNGDAKIGISLVPTVVINDVTLANPEWAKSPYMAKFEKLKVEFKIMPLLQKRIEIDELVLVAPQIFLETSPNGLNNWQFGNTEKEKPAITQNNMPAKPQIKEAAAVLGIGLVAENVIIEDGSVDYFDAKTNKHTNLIINKIEMQIDGENEPIKLIADAIYDGGEIKADLTANTLSSIINDGKTSFEAQINALNIEASLQGSVEGIFAKPIYAMMVNIYNPAGNMGAPETTAELDIDGDSDAANVIFNSLNVATNKLTGRATVKWNTAKPYINVVLSTGVFDVNSLNKNSVFAKIEIPSLIGEAQALTMVPQTSVPYKYLGMINGDFNIKAGKLILNDGLTFKDVVLNAVLQNGILNVKDLSLGVGNGKIDVDLIVDSKKQSISGTLLSKNLRLQDLNSAFANHKGASMQVLNGGNIDIDAKLASVGSTYRRLSETLDGQVIVIVDNSVVKTEKLDWLTSSLIGQILNMLGIKTNKINQLDVLCAVARTDIKNGKAMFPTGIVLNTKQVKIVGNGDVNLMNDKIDFTIAPMMNNIADGNITQALASFMKIGGTLQNPKLSLDKSSALTTIVGSVATGGIYLGSEIMLSGDDNPCHNSLTGTKYANRFPKPVSAKSITKDVYQGVTGTTKDAVKELGKTAKNLFDAFTK